MRWTNLAMALVGCVLLAQGQAQAQGQAPAPAQGQAPAQAQGQAPAPAQGQAQAQVNAGDPALLGHWPFEEGYGIFSADKGPYGREAMLHGASWAAGGFGKALRCDGENSFASLPPMPELDGSDELSLSLWVYWEGSGRYPNILSAGWNPGGFMIFVADDYCSFRMGRPGHRANVPGEEWREIEAPIVRGLPKDRWVHIGVSFSRPDIRTYLNGKLAGSAKWDYPVATGGDIQLGHWAGNTTHRGLIDDLRIYKRALSGDEMAELADWTSHAQSGYEIVDDHPVVPEVARWETSDALFVVGEDGQLHSCRLKATADSAERELLSAPAPLPRPASLPLARRPLPAPKPRLSLSTHFRFLIPDPFSVSRRSFIRAVARS